MFDRFFVNLQLPGRSLERGRISTYIKSDKGVYRCLSSAFKLGRLKRDEDNLTIAPASVAYSRRIVGVSICYTVWGCCFYLSRGQAKA